MGGNEDCGAGERGVNFHSCSLGSQNLSIIKESSHEAP